MKSKSAISLIEDRFRREAKKKREDTIGRIVYALVQINGEVSYQAIRKALHKLIEESPSNRGEIAKVLDTQFLDAEAALMQLLDFHGPHDDR